MLVVVVVALRRLLVGVVLLLEVGVRLDNRLASVVVVGSSLLVVVRDPVEVHLVRMGELEVAVLGVVLERRFVVV